ncbi:hypothetical protein PK28_14300 [Hymenobacter sp. DG25B]|uniref:hypothetical protein n=1 Tax=Hymenobacter sp. DG25B TaxID=1385664 RepID=UPI0005407F03|nr:hypothetical protein [Hymenobacter sp. DG25B]AIZ64552.1 hypothetical protein PK28_14300 [Hymenobacter sp. DG25B]
MNTKLVMTLSAAALILAGLSLTFLPNEIARLSGVGQAPVLNVLLQTLGALYFAFAMLNWMTKGSRIGGIYNRPIALANFAHFFMVALALLKALMSNPQLPAGLWLVAGVYAVFAGLFSLILFRHPLAEPEVSV